MSMNLRCDKVDLWQTPTHISYMCLSNNDGGWRGIKYRYIEWAKSTLNGLWHDKEELEDAREGLRMHIEELESHKRLKFWVM